MATIRTAIQITDGMSPAFRAMNNAMNIVLNSFESLQTASSHAVDTNSIKAARQELAKAEIAINSVEQEIKAANDQQKKFNEQMRSGQDAASGLVSKIKGLVAVFAGTMAVKEGMTATDEYINQKARLSLVNDGLQTQEQLQQKIFESAQRSKSAYGDTVSNVAKLNLLAKDAFKSNDEAIKFTELMSKSFKISGSSASEASNGMYQLTQAMAAGRLQGDEFRSVMENAPLAAQAIANYTGKSMGELRQMSADGTITADIIKRAMFAAADDINAKFAKMPNTFESVWTSIKNKATIQFSQIMQNVNNYLNSVQGTQVINSISNSIGILSVWIGNLLNMIMAVSAFFVNNWSWIEPVIWGIVWAMIAYNTVSIITNGIIAAITFAEKARAAATAISKGATFAATVAQYGLNAALYACPITWIIGLVILLIVIFYAAVGAINHFAGTSISATGVITGAFAALGAFLWNLFLAVFDLILAVINNIVNPFIRVANFIGNVFTSPISSIIYAFQSMADGILGTLQRIASAMDFVFGTHMADTIGKWRSGLKDMADAAVKEYAPNENYKKIINELDLSAGSLGLKRIEYGNAYNAGYDWGKNVESSFSLSNIFDNPDLKFTNDIADTAANTAAMKDSMSSTGEDLKYLRDLAEQDTINRFTTAEIKVDMTNHNNIASNMDLDGVVAYLGEKLDETLNVAAEGVYA